ncbi:MAG: hypothetical protein JWO78_75 [Micavibrio sp.]|nr:hypothetical protein [Micavibrio sp.]
MIPKNQTAKNTPPRKINMRSVAATSIALITGIAFLGTMALLIEARHHNFYGGPLSEKMMQLAYIHLHGLPDDPEKRARLESGIFGLNLLPPQAVLPPAAAERFNRAGITFAYVQENVRPGNGSYLCQATDIGLIPAVAANIAAALSIVPGDVLRAMNLKTIVLCGDLLQGKKKVGGFPVPPDNLMLLSLTHRTRPADIQDFFLHEFYHLFEARNNITADANWDRLYKGYANAYRGAADSSNNLIGKGKPGFINRYSQSFAYEDRAEIFAKLMTDRPALMQLITTRNDQVLYSKTQYVAETARLLMKIDIAPF